MAGLKNWRPFRLVGAHRDSSGHLVGGHMAFAENDQIADFSLVQYTGTETNPKQDVKAARFFYNGAELGFYEYVRVAVSGGKMSFNPIYELKATMKTLCNDLNDRAQYVDLDIKDGISVKNHPGRLPDNIYGSDDKEWEEYSTPSRDARIKTAFAQFYKDLAEMIGLWVRRDPRIVYDGVFLQKDLREAYADQSTACTITYLSSAKKPVPMTFDDMMHRLFKISFDPYHCVELRWGAEDAEREVLPGRGGQAEMVRRRATAQEPARPHLRSADGLQPRRTRPPRQRHRHRQSATGRHQGADRLHARPGRLSADEAGGSLVMMRHQQRQKNEGCAVGHPMGHDGRPNIPAPHVEQRQHEAAERRNDDLAPAAAR